MTRKELIESLLDQLKKKTEAYESILSLSVQEREKAASGDFDGVEEINSRKETYISELKSVDREMDRVRGDLSTNLGGVEVTVEAIRRVAGNAAEELSSVTARARSLISRILDAEKINGKLYREKRMQIKDELDRIGRSRRMNYAYNRPDEDLLSGSKFIDHKK